MNSLILAPWLLLCGALLGTAAAAPAKKRKAGDEQKVPMPHHSFQVPLEYQSVLDDWSVSGATLVERDRLLLHPAVPERAGFAWNKLPVLTNNFEVIIHFRVVGEKQPQKVLYDQSFGFWYAYENISQVYNETQNIKAESWAKGMQEQGLTLGGMKAVFEGMGVVLSMADKEKRPKPLVSGVTNDGHTTLSWYHDVPAEDAKAIDFRNTLNAAQLKIRVRPTSVEGWLKQSPSLSWQECFAMDRSKHPIKAGGFIGLTAWSGTTTDGALADLVSVAQVEVNNFDDTSIGEENKDVSTQIQDTLRDMLTDEHRHFLDQKSQTDHIGRLVEILGTHINTTAPADRQLFEELKTLEERVERLGEDCRQTLKAAHLIMGSNGRPGQAHKAGVEEMRHEIIGLRRLLVKDGATHSQKLEAVVKNVAEVKEKQSKEKAPEALGVIARQTETLEKSVRHRGSQMSWMMFCLMAAVFAIGWLMWNRMRYYEKRHFI